MSTHAPLTTYRNPALLTEILQFHPQLLLDDVVNVAYETLYHAVEALEVFLLRWADDRAEAIAKEVDGGLYAFQTLLESYADTAFDFFEVWALRNVFSFPPADVSLPIILPHHAGLNLILSGPDEDELRSQLDQMRIRVREARKLNVQLRKSNRMAERRLARARERLQHYSFLRDTTAVTAPAADLLADLLQALFTLPAASYATATGSTKRPWEHSSTGYLRWGVRRLVDRGRSGAVLEAMVDKVQGIGAWEVAGTSRSANS
ncbi:hypothetical protein DACRYDRAFT_110083 [Dacryopinax primogenitus]|uniref:Mis12-domain-containing protein n=1 Tax=Dacryopinax primogenitus (strain DJM 731) TaxID=1858805 RepID=M5FQV5_DACPD|nr:uncharacterized protein DACRYDRAFT_110083 [Dacryopinax primogenitus]EJT99365.1 hypothetical protein DACRYDRAFT_110083 [Dacryopinax primogenitus]